MYGLQKKIGTRHKTRGKNTITPESSANLSEWLDAFRNSKSFLEENKWWKTLLKTWSCLNVVESAKERSAMLAKGSAPWQPRTLLW